MCFLQIALAGLHQVATGCRFRGKRGILWDVMKIDGSLAHRNFYTQKLLHTKTFTHRSFYTQTLSHTETGPVKSQFYFSFWRSTSISRVRVARDTSKPQFSSVFDVQRPFRAKGLRWTPQNRNFPQFLTSNVHFVRKGCDGLTKIAILSQFLTSNVHFVRKGCDVLTKIALFPQFLTSNVHFVRKGCDVRTKIAICLQFLTSNVHFVRKGCDGLTKIALFSQFLTSNVRFVRKGSVSWRSGGTAPALRER